MSDKLLHEDVSKCTGKWESSLTVLRDNSFMAAFEERCGDFSGMWSSWVQYVSL